MVLDLYQKSVFLIILNATMILRSVGKTMKKNKSKLKKFKVAVFKEIEKLTDLVDKKQIKEVDIITSIEKISNNFGISFGQAQKAINVILKYYFYLFSDHDKQVEKTLHCPLDKVVLKKLGKRVFLTEIDRKQYEEFQCEIKSRSSTRI